MIHVRSLGTSEVRVGAHRIAPDSAVLFALALYLSATAGQRVRRTRLLELFWPELPDGSRRHALRQLLYRLRLVGFSSAMEGEELQVEEGEVDSDLTRVLAAGWPESAGAEDIVAASRVLPGYDPALGAPYREWLDELRSRVGLQYRRALLRQIEGARRDGRWHDVGEWARRCLAVDPLNEEATLAHAEAIAMSGSKAQALQIIDEYLDELGDRERVIGLPAKVLRRRVSERIPERRGDEDRQVPLIGREREIGRLHDLLRATRSGQGSAVVVVGAAGIGKSRLTHELVVSASIRGWRAASARLQPSDAHRPLGLFVDLFSTLLQMEGALGCSPESLTQLKLLTEHATSHQSLLGKSQEAEAVQERLRLAAVDLFESVLSEGPLLVITEDLHWCDRSSHRLLQVLVGGLSSLPLLWVITMRAEGPFGTVRDALVSLDTTVLPLGPLTRDDAVILFATMRNQDGSGTAHPPLGDDSATLAGGNPLFIRELARHVTVGGDARSLPDSLGALIRDRVARLSPLAQQVLHTCAILGRSSSVNRVASVLEVGTSELLGTLHELDSLGIVGTEQDGGTLRLHDLWQEEVLRTVMPAAQRLLHHRCGVVIESECRVRRSAALIWEAATHLVAGGSESRALGLLEECAHHQLDNGLPIDAAATFGLALQASTSDVDRVRAITGRLTALERAADWSEIGRTIGPAIELSARAAALHSPHSELELLQAETMWWTEADPEEGLCRSIACACDETATASHRIRAASIGVKIAANLAKLSSVKSAVHFVAQLPCATQEDRISILSMLTVFHTEAGDLDIADSSSQELIALERARGSIRGLARALRFSSMLLRVIGKFDLALTQLGEALGIAERSRAAGDAASAASSIVDVYLDQGDVPSATRALDRAKAWSNLVGAKYARTSDSIQEAMIALELGQYHSIRTTLDCDIARHAADPLVRQKLLSLAVLVRLFAEEAETASLGEATRLMGVALREVQTIGRLDFVVTSYVAGMVALKDEETAHAFLRGYMHTSRRDRARPSQSLLKLCDDLAVPSESVRILEGTSAAREVS